MNCRPAIILPTVSKIYENILYTQIYEHFNKGLHTGILLTDLPKVFILYTQIYEHFNKGLHTGILLTDLPKVFDCISHD